MAVNIPIWDGSSTFAVGQTPLGFYDAQPDFVSDIDKVVDWCAQKLGYPVSDVELPSGSFYSCFEEAVNEYAGHVNTYNIRDNFINLYASTASVQLTQKAVSANLQGIIELAQDYGTEAGAIGNVNVYSASISVKNGVQVYDLTSTSSVAFEQGSPATDSFEIRRVFHEAPPAITRFFDPFVGSGLGSQNMIDSFGFGGYSPGVSFMMMPLYADMLRIQAIEFNDQIRKSAYSFELINNKLRLFPIPNGSAYTKVYFQYILKADRSNPLKGAHGTISDFSNVPYQNVTYSDINVVGRQWIQKYSLALAKEMLGYIRGKYSTLPIPNSEITLNSADLISAAQTEKEGLVTELKETLDTMSRQMQLERKAAEATSLQEQFNKIPLKIYIG